MTEKSEAAVNRGKFAKSGVNAGIPPSTRSPQSNEALIKEALNSVNSTSQVARTMWLGFLGLLAYLFITLASVTHKDLLLNSAIKLPIIDVALPLLGFFVFAPSLLFIFHFGLLMQHITLALKLDVFDQAIARETAETEKDGDEDRRKSINITHPARSQLHGYAFTQYISGPRVSWFIRNGQWLMSWLTLNILPLIILLYFQTQFLPFHSEAVTWWHRANIAFNLLLLACLGFFVDRPSLFFRDVITYNYYHKRTRFMLMGVGAGLVLSWSLCIATFPDERAEQFIIEAISNSEKVKQVLSEKLRQDLLVERNGRTVFRPTDLFFEDNENDVSVAGGLNWFSRNLTVTDTDLVPDSVSEPNELSFSLRHRELKYANLARSDFHRVDFTGADLSYAVLNGARLDNANLTNAKLNKAKLILANLTNARLLSAELIRADLSYANLEGTNFQGLESERPELFKKRQNLDDMPLGANLSGAILNSAKLYGTNLSYAILKGADLNGANILGTEFDRTNLLGANFRYALIFRSDIDGPYLAGAMFDGAQLFSTEILTQSETEGASFDGSDIWKSSLINSVDQASSVGSNLYLNIPGESVFDNFGNLKSEIEIINSSNLRIEMKKNLRLLREPENSEKWQESSFYTTWKEFGSKNNDLDKFRGAIRELVCKKNRKGPDYLEGFKDHEVLAYLRGRKEAERLKNPKILIESKRLQRLKLQIGRDRLKDPEIIRQLKAIRDEFKFIDQEGFIIEAFVRRVLYYEKPFLNTVPDHIKTLAMVLLDPKCKSTHVLDRDMRDRLKAVTEKKSS